ncbi:MULTISPECIES: alpha/beta fold hydrolase [Microbacterium]|uniref:alpha/beta fold hydrolase n=1 Tax=Microbacterium TaxID=33882 RepID=UPI00217D1173|nr:MULTISPECIES: alpha/beta hydrolase [Microbacterium]UWF77042.1 alpha/beta hydrolase [Microbacterium neungamense]WCM55202.1 alpha/beta hydrolase [Microbacterium sp. EF45047]
MDTPASHTAGTTTWSPPLPDAPGFEHRMVDTPGLRTHIATIGTGDPVLMLHGFPQHWWQWRRIGPRLAAAGYRVICPDLRGSGWTEADEQGYRRETMLHDVVALLDALGLPRVRVVSHDLGSVVAGQLAYAHAERVRSAVQLSVPPGFMIFTPKLLPAFRHMPRMLRHREGASLRWVFGGPWTATPMTDETIDGYLRVHSRPEVSRAVRALYRGMVIPEVMRLSRGDYKRMRLHPPTLAAFGREDGPFREEIVRRICREADRRADRFELAFVEGAAHFMTDDAPDEVAELILDWFRRS